MIKKVTKWALKEIRTDREEYLLSKKCFLGYGVVSLDDENIFFLPTREIARNYCKSIDGNFTPQKVTIQVE